MSIGYSVGTGGTILKTVDGGTTGIDDFRKSSIIVSTYPNPFVDEITVSVKSGAGEEISITIYDLDGKRVFQAENKGVRS